MTATWSWFSPAIKAPMALTRWGEVGTPVLLFPTAGGDSIEIERFLMIDALSPLLAAGRIKVYSVSSVPGDAWFRDTGTVAYRTWLQNRFDHCLYHEAVPIIRRDCQTHDVEIVTAGPSLGAFNAVSLVVRHPDVFSVAIGMSGTYDFEHWLDGHLDDEFYYASPCHFLPNLDDEEHLALLRQRFIILGTGEGDWESPGQSWRMADVLGRKGVPNRVDLWGPDFSHDWVSWRHVLPGYLDAHA